MVEGVFIFFILAAVIAVAGVFFFVWIIASIARAIAGACSAGRPRNVRAIGGPQLCGNPQCKIENPPHARFCRRCGQSLPMLMKILPATAAA